MTLIYMIITLGIMVIVHELGHFLVAKLFKIGVPVFSIGMGKRLFGITKNGTDYRVSLMPFGGYVHLKGMETFEQGEKDDDDFMVKHPLKRIAVIFSGPFANFILSFILLFIMTLAFGVSYMPNTPVYSIASPYDSLFLRGDFIESVNGNDIKYYIDIFKYLKPNEINNISILRDGADKEVAFKLDKPDSFLIYPEICTKVGMVSPGSPAEKSGIMKNDIILAIDTLNIKTWQEMSEIIKQSYDISLSIKIERGADTLLLSVIPEKKEQQDGDSTMYYGVVGIGYSSELMKPGFKQGISLTIERVNYIASSIVKFLAQLFTGKMSVKNLGGPISIYTMTGESLKWGFDSFLAFVAFFSLNLFIFNLIPFPPLDGSYILIFLFELFTKKRATTKFMNIYQQIGFVTLMLLIVLVSFNDILRIVMK
ncbi:TPA: RIP metalloprotease RseP [candidate division WOR-3 bacterium]|uniref:Zinc metalloprotease n=1 Tax=candidate division WOR-3 bacterium TaxID=2052148 RepID=A0A350HC12_UNCW3|nr:RIP metalloprotease RseP [candidate division WOR-3 bacterium]